MNINWGNTEARIDLTKIKKIYIKLMQINK